MKDLQHLIDKCIDNDSVAQTTLYNMFNKLLYTVTQKFFLDISTQDEAVQRTYIKVFNSLTKYKTGGSFKSWIATICRNECIDMIRKYQKKLENINIDIDISEMYNIKDDEIFEIDRQENLEEEKIIHNSILKIIGKIPLVHKQTFKLYHMEGMTHNEIAKELNVSATTSKLNYSKAKKNIKEEIIKQKLITL